MAKTLAVILLGVDKLSKTLANAGTGLEKLQGKMEKFQGAANVAGVAAGAALLAGVQEAMNRDAGQGLLNAQLGLTAKESERIGKVAGDLFANNFGSSMDEVNGAVKAVVQNMDGMRDASASALQQTTGRAMTLSKVLDEDVGRVTAGVTNLMRTGLAKSSQEAFDIIAKGAQLGGNRASDLLDTFEEYAVQFQSMGLSGQQAMGLITQGLASGARNADLVADTIKEFSIEAVAGSDRVRGGFQSLGLNADQMVKKFAAGGPTAAKAFDQVLDKLRGIEDPARRNAVAIELFGTKAEDMGQALYALDPSAAAAKLDGFKGAVDRAGSAMGETASGRIESFKRSIIGAFVEVVGNRVLPVVDSFIQKLKAIGIDPSAFVVATMAIGALALAVKAAGIATTVYNGLAGLSATASKVWAGAVWLVNAALRANPIGIVITVLTALVAAVVLAYNKSETFRKIVQTAWRGIQMAVAFAWENVIKPAFMALHKFVTGTLAPTVLWLWNNIIKPAWKGISFAIEVAWGIIKIIFAAFKMFLERVVAPVVTWLWKNIIVPAWTAISAVISRVWNSGVKPVFDNMKKGVDLVGRAFESAKNFIGRVWDKVRDLAMKPVRFVVETVYTKGIKGVWDKVAKFVGADPLPAAPRFASGGRITNGTTSKADDVLARVSRGEFVVNAAATRRNLGLIDYVNSQGKSKNVLKEMSLAGDPGGVIPGFAEGGIIGWIKNFGRQAKDFFTNGLAKALDGVIGPVKGLIDRTLGTSGIGGLIGGVPKRFLDSMRGWLMARKDKLEGGGGSQKAVSAARSQLGVPYSWGGGGPGGPGYGFAQGAGIRGFDCSSLMQYSWYKATGKVMPRTTYTQWPWLDKVSTPKPGDLGFPHMGHVFMYSGKGKIIEAPYTGAHVREVPARSARWGRPPASFRRMDSGGVIRPGMNPPIYNGTGSNEYVMTGRQAAAAGSVSIAELHVHVPYGADEVNAGRSILKAIQAAVKRDGKGAVRVILP